MFYGVSEIFLRPRKIPLTFLLPRYISPIFRLLTDVRVRALRVAVARALGGAELAGVGVRRFVQVDVHEEAINTPFCPLQETFHTLVLRGLRNISEAP